MEEKIKTLLTRGVEEVIVRKSLEERLRSNKSLTVKLGIDPTGAELHLGHAVVLRKLREFQNLGHQVVLVIGDFTAKIGDPSGRTEERKHLTDKQIKENMKSYREQAGKILDLEKTKFVYNSEWLKNLGLEGLLELASKVTLAQLMERKEFRERVKSDVDVPYLEMFYPMMQGYDSVALKADVELGGRDQKFNLLMGRQIQKRYGQKEQDIVIMKLLPGTDGAKMSKSAENYISLTTSPHDMYGKIMSISDELMPIYYELCTYIEPTSANNFSNKKMLAYEIVKTYHGEKLAQEAEENFRRVFQEGKYEESRLIEKVLPRGEYKPVELAIASGATTSTVQAKELFRQGAVEINGKVISIKEWSEPIVIEPGTTIKIGKRRIIKAE
ncbi:MAG: tyrosine--tRNA ligase [Patescibacteria group bacterium]